MTKAGTINTQPVSMLRERVRSVGISLLGGNAGVEGPYELGIAEIRAVNEEDVTVPPRTSSPTPLNLRFLNVYPFFFNKWIVRSACQDKTRSGNEGQYKFVLVVLPDGVCIIKQFSARRTCSHY
jgi:hypothetical protein